MKQQLVPLKSPPGKSPPEKVLHLEMNPTRPLVLELSVKDRRKDRPAVLLMLKPQQVLKSPVVVPEVPDVGAPRR